MKPTERFSDRVEDYVKYRPHYPETVVDYLRDTYFLSPEWTIADIGSGTGISAELFLGKGNLVYGVEPNPDMRKKAEELLGGRFISIDGTAEATGLQGGCVDLVVAGQAFHWFDPVRSRAEFVRILRPGGVVVLVWNERLIETGFEQEYEALILQYGTDYKTINHKNISDEKIGAFFHPAAFSLAVFPNEQRFDLAGLKGRLLSSSYIPKEGPAFAAMIGDLERLFDRHQSDGRVRVGYDTKVYSGIPDEKTHA
ncbi:MAG TPA: class I SAM-dependent methyltransferase [Puia sp.]|jgi:SAM-dependent methyltransferase|nr:class I SAM-dependent methyltransferase [Puia sp.]